MDPFQPSSRIPHAFRAVPMTHLTRPSKKGWEASLQAAECSRAPPPPPSSASSATTDQLHRSSGILKRVELHMAAEAVSAGSSIDNVRKWQQFGLRVTSSDVPVPRSSQYPQPAQQRMFTTAQVLTDSRQGLSVPQLSPLNPLVSRDAEAVYIGAVGEGNKIPGSSRPETLPGAVTRSAEGPRARTRELDVIEIVDNGDGITCSVKATPPPPPSRARHSLQNRSPSSPTPAVPRQPPAAPSTPAAGSVNDTTSSEAVRHLQLTLAQLSEKVQHSTEEQRCGPPKRNSSNNNGGGSGRGGPPSWAAQRWGNATKKTKAAAGQHDGGNEGNSEGDSANDNSAVTAAPGTDRAHRVRDNNRKGNATRKRSGGAGRGAPDEATTRKTGMKKRRKADVSEGATKCSNAGPPESFLTAPRTLFSFSTSNGGGGEGGVLAGVSGVPTAAATVSVPFFYLQTSADDLFDDVHRTLNDPDRIQAPPLFVGISTLASNSGDGIPLVECRTNFTFHSSASKTVKGRASNCFFSIDPVYSHLHVELVFARWKDAVYALPAQTLGFPFLCRVLAELPGVELITFNAQALLVALLAHCKGTLWSHCVSDVRVMAWMAQLHVSSSSAQPQRTFFTSTGDRSAGGGGRGSAADTDMNVLYDYDQLLLRVSAGKPLPSVLLERASETDYHSSNSGVTAAGSFTPAPSSGEAPPPPLTPAQRLLAQQVYYLATVYRSLYGLLGSKGLLQAFLRQEKRIALLLALMRFNGIGVDLPEVHRYQKACEAEMTRQRNTATALVPEMGNNFNIQSHDQCRRALYEVLQLGKFLTAKGQAGEEAAAGSGLTITKGGRLSTAEDTLRALTPHHEFPACLLKYRKASKLMQTYVEGMMSYAIVRTEKTNADSAVATLSNAYSPLRPSLNENASSLAAPQLCGEAADVNNASSNPFVDHQLNAGAETRISHNNDSGNGDHLSRPTKSPDNGNSRLSADEEASTTAIGDLTLPDRGYATIHPNFLQEGTDTGRLSCIEPNLQNLPRSAAANVPATTSTAAVGEGEGEEEDLLGFRRCFVAPPGFVLLSVDYQQIELRVLAHLCGDKALIDALTRSADIHRAIAEVVFRKKPVSSEERTLAKRVVFGMLYGAGPKTLAAHMGVNVERALHITSLLTSAFPGIETYHRRVIEECRVNGFVRTISGRLRYLPDIHSTVMARRSYAERQAFNSVVQGSAADVMKMAMLAVARDVLQQHSRSDVCLTSQIHDEMVFSVRKELLSTLVPLISAAMSHAMHLLVPLSVTVKFGHSLGELQEWSVENDLGLGVEG
jgi:DNA polymerase I